METLKALVFGVVVSACVMLYAKPAASEPLHYEVQIVTGGRVVAETYAIRARDELARVLPHFELFVEVVPHPGATTVKVTVVSRHIGLRNQARIREILEATLRKPFVIVNGYANQPQAPTSAHESH